MAHVYAQVELQRTTQLPVDKVVNGFHFRVPLVNATALDTIRDRVRAFYTAAAQGNTSPLSSDFASNYLSASGHVIKMYDMTLPAPRPPARVDTLTLVMGATSVLPAEVALCLSYRGTLVSGENPRNSRGRLYFGPVATGTAIAQSGDSRPENLFMNRLLNAGAALMNLSTATTAEWIVFSETTGQQTQIRHLWCDNAWDTQRRRGLAPSTTRLTRDQASV